MMSSTDSEHTTAFFIAISVHSCPRASSTSGRSAASGAPSSSAARTCSAVATCSPRHLSNACAGAVPLVGQHEVQGARWVLVFPLQDTQWGAASQNCASIPCTVTPGTLFLLSLCSESTKLTLYKSFRRVLGYFVLQAWRQGGVGMQLGAYAAF